MPVSVPRHIAPRSAWAWGPDSGVSGLECGAGQVRLQLHSSSRALGPDTAALPGTQSPLLLLALVLQELLYVLGRGWGPSG